MSEPLIERIAAALQAHRDATLLLQELASELLDHTQRVRELADRLEGTRVALARKEIAQTQADYAPMDVRNIPTILHGGPVRGER
jgi:hypothetical protein